ncbi:cystatin [Anolis carolinensis]|nr:PREDICTED: cystatin-11 [Anolis carolinensis]|eukprot:XP_003220074.1 PREDICTED: cystatin-11 [Anolis carolinensis]
MALFGWIGMWGVLLLGAALATGQKQRMMGAPIEVSADDEGVQQALRFAMNEYNRASNDRYGSRVDEVLSVTKQIVAGVKYNIAAKVGRTTCSKSEANLETCAFHEAPELARHVTCHFEVYSVPWLNKITLKRNNCQ